MRPIATVNRRSKRGEVEERQAEGVRRISERGEEQSRVGNSRRAVSEAVQKAINSCWRAKNANKNMRVLQAQSEETFSTYKLGYIGINFSIHKYVQ